MAPVNSSGPAVSRPFSRLEMPRNSRDRMTPEFPRAPRNMALATQSAAAEIVSNSFFRSSVAAFAMVSPMFVPVSPSGTGKTFKSLMA